MTKAALPQKHAVPSPVLQLQTPELLSHHCFDHAATHILSVLGLVNSLLNLLKAPIVYLNKAATGFYTLIAKPRFLVTQYTRFFVREDIHTCYFINTDKTITFLVTELISYSFISLVNITIGSNVSALTLGCLRCENTEKQLSILQLGLQTSKARLSQDSDTHLLTPK